MTYDRITEGARLEMDLIKALHALAGYGYTAEEIEEIVRDTVGEYGSSEDKL